MILVFCNEYFSFQYTQNLGTESCFGVVMHSCNVIGANGAWAKCNSKMFQNVSTTKLIHIVMRNSFCWQQVFLFYLRIIHWVDNWWIPNGSKTWFCLSIGYQMYHHKIIDFVIHQVGVLLRLLNFSLRASGWTWTKLPKVKKECLTCAGFCTLNSLFNFHFLLLIYFHQDLDLCRVSLRWLSCHWR